jgi:hypothetical protein
MYAVHLPEVYFRVSVGCPSVSAQKVGHVLISSFKKRDAPKFKAFSKKIGVKSETFRILS